MGSFSLLLLTSPPAELPMPVCSNLDQDLAVANRNVYQKGLNLYACVVHKQEFPEFAAFLKKPEILHCGRSLMQLPIFRDSLPGLPLEEKCLSEGEDRATSLLRLPLPAVPWSNAAMEKELLASPRGKLQCFLPGGWKENHAAGTNIILLIVITQFS